MVKGQSFKLTYTYTQKRKGSQSQCSGLFESQQTQKTVMFLHMEQS